MTTNTNADNGSGEKDFLNLKDIDYIEFYVGNVRQAMHFYRTIFGFKPTAYCGLETGSTDKISYVVEQRQIRLALTSSLDTESPISKHIIKHGDGVKDIAFRVDDATNAFEQTVKRGAVAVQEPTLIEDDHGQVVRASIAAYGDTVHSFIERRGYEGPFLPGYSAVPTPFPYHPTHLAAIDHVAINVDPGTLNEWVDFYEKVMGFHLSHQEDIVTPYTAMNSKVVQNSTGRIKFPMQEPALGKRKSQIEEFLTFYKGSGVQHVALLSSDIIKSVGMLQNNGIEFLRTPSTYYEVLEDRVGKLEEEITELQRFNILADCDRWGYLMQTFSKPIENRPTIFMEIIQRKGARGFGSGNIKALFEAIEREQALRGTL